VGGGPRSEKGDTTVTRKALWSKETFRGIAKESGLETDQAHLDSVYAYLQGLFPSLKTIEDLDLIQLEPFMPSLTKKE
jgi:hypothetical protein